MFVDGMPLWAAFRLSAPERTLHSLFFPAILGVSFLAMLLLAVINHQAPLFVRLTTGPLWLTGIAIFFVLGYAALVRTMDYMNGLNPLAMRSLAPMTILHFSGLVTLGVGLGMRPWSASILMMFLPLMSLVSSAGMPIWLEYWNLHKLI